MDFKEFFESVYPINEGSVNEEIPSSVGKTMENFLKKKPLKKFSFKQVGEIFKAISLDDRSKLNSIIIDIDSTYKFGAQMRFRTLAKDSAVSNIETITSNDSTGLVKYQYHFDQDYLAVAYYLTNDYSFLKGGKIFTVYVDAVDIERYKHSRLYYRENHTGLKNGDIINIVGNSANDWYSSDGFNDAVWLKVEDVEDKTVTLTVLDSTISNLKEIKPAYKGANKGFTKIKKMKSSGSKTITVTLNSYGKYFDIDDNSKNEILKLFDKSVKTIHVLDVPKKDSNYGLTTRIEPSPEEIRRISDDARKLSQENDIVAYYKKKGPGGWTGD